MSSFLLKTNGRAPAIEPEGKTWTLEELQKYVGGLIEIVAAPNHPGRVMVINEEGRLNDLPVNKSATVLYQYDTIVGDVVLTTTELIE